MARFYPLSVAEVRRETRDAVVVTLAPRDEDRAAFDFIQGQYLTFRREFDGEELRRSYSICAGRDEGALRVGIKRVDGGAFSTWANEELKAGDLLEAMPPMGSFHTALDPDRPRSYLGFAGGSGITPVLSLVKTILAREPRSRFTLVYGNRSINAIMFREELEDLKNSYLGRFSVVHVLESEAQDIELFSGRIDGEKCARLFKGWIDIGSVDMAFICGPEPMMLAIAQALRDHGLRDDQIKFELFASAPRRARHKVEARAAAATAELCRATITLDGTTRVIEMPKRGESILDAALGASLDAPYACKAGVCSTCRAMVLEGEVEMETNHALEDYEVRRGYVLTCQCFPLSDSVVVSYDQ
jgi:ring-1,2-phenylacetyl-CoA epoxidase subunit PaaE